MQLRCSRFGLFVEQISTLGYYEQYLLGWEEQGACSSPAVSKPSSHSRSETRAECPAPASPATQLTSSPATPHRRLRCSSACSWSWSQRWSNQLPAISTVCIELCDFRLGFRPVSPKEPKVLAALKTLVVLYSDEGPPDYWSCRSLFLRLATFLLF